MSQAAENLDDVQSEKEKPSRKEWLWSEFKFFAKLFAFIIAFLTLVWGHFKIPSESMQPTLEVGDHLYVSKFAYGYSKHSLPYLLHNLPLPEGRIFSKLPERGDVVVYRNPHTGVVMIKRTIGLPGDRVQMQGGQLYINDELVPRQKVDTRVYLDHKYKRQIRVDVYEQSLPGSDEIFLIYEQSDRANLDDTKVFTVPDNHLFFMGDGRDNSTDSRSTALDRDGVPIGPGMVHMNYVMGRADRVMFSLKRCDRELEFYCPPKGRFMEKL